MGELSNIEWCQATWNPWHGCHKISPGCKNCYMFRDKERYGQDPNVVVRSKTQFEAPLKWKESRLIFTCSWSDWFIEEADVWRDEAYEIIRRTPQHTYQILTKRADRMEGRVPNPPLPNVWLGVSVENQQYADERIPLLLDTPAAVRFLSVEPLLGPVSLAQWTEEGLECAACSWVGTEGQAAYVSDSEDSWYACPSCGETCAHTPLDELLGSAIHWVIVGGESGPNARPMHPVWARDVRDQCVAAGVPYFFKQNGEWIDLTPGGPVLKQFKFPDGLLMHCIGKKKAGRLLDGQEWNQMPSSYGVKA